MAEKTPYNICVVTGTRADYGLLRPLIARVSDEPLMKLRLAVTGMHLCPEFGYTYREIVADGFPIDYRADMLLGSDSAAAMTKSTGLGMIAFADYFAASRPDMLVVLGDRFETFAAAAAAAMTCIPVAHIYGGDTSEGAVDEFLRHAVTKMSALHFTSNEESQKRVIQLGEHPDTVFNVGALNVECVKSAELISGNALSRELGVELSGRYALVTYHPETLSAESSRAKTAPLKDLPVNSAGRTHQNGEAEAGIEALLRALDTFPDVQFIVTKSNADSGGRAINAAIERAAAVPGRNISVFTSLGSRRYLSLMRHAAAVIGNSSSGIYETPVFGIPAVNIGDRQKGRTRANNVINCKPIYDDIISAILTALSPEFKKIAKKAVSPFGSGDTSKRIVCRILDYLRGERRSTAKSFYTLNEAERRQRSDL